jgi:hypothetical protein
MDTPDSRSTVDWTNCQIRVRYVKGQRRTESIYPVTCPDCGHERWLKRHDAFKAEQMSCSCYHCAQREKGRQGWRVTAARWGVKVAVKHQRAYRLANPSNLEQQCMALLDGLGVSYQREVWFERQGKVYLIDFVVSDRLAIEVNGTFVHRHRAEDDALKHAALRQQYPLLILTDVDFDTAQAAVLLQAFLHDHL